MWAVQPAQIAGQILRLLQLCCFPYMSQQAQHSSTRLPLMGMEIQSIHCLVNRTWSRKPGTPKPDHPCSPTLALALQTCLPQNPCASASPSAPGITFPLHGFCQVHSLMYLEMLRWKMWQVLSIALSSNSCPTILCQAMSCYLALSFGHGLKYCLQRLSTDIQKA